MGSPSSNPRDIDIANYERIRYMLSQLAWQPVDAYIWQHAQSAVDPNEASDKIAAGDHGQ
jgi:hypothetical protein